MKKILFFIILTFLLCFNLYAQQQNSFSKKSIVSNSKSVEKTSRLHKSAKFNINNISTFIYNDGNQDISLDGNSGFEFPKGNKSQLVFESGILWGGMVSGEIRVGGSSYSSGLRGGKLFDDGTAQNPEDPSVRVYRVRPDYTSADLTSEIEDEELPESEIRAQYQQDWIEWPADFGAPFNDIDNNGIYDPSVDIPGVPGSHQTLWYVANDLDTSTSRSLYSSDPMKVELQVTIWGYNIPGPYRNVMFKKYKLINKSKDKFEKMFFSQWSDPDVGNASDDCLGLDTLLNLKYAYNGDEFDESFYSAYTNRYHLNSYGLLAPSIGFQILQGPIIPSSNDNAYFDGKILPGYKNLETYSFSFDTNEPTDFYWDEIPNIRALISYNRMNGLFGTTGSPATFPDELGGGWTRLPYSGNPITGEGWIQLMTEPVKDVRGMITTGPVTMNPGDTQELVIAQIAGQGTDRLNSIAVLKYYASILQKDYPNLNTANPISNIFELKSQLIKNEFNAYDEIELSIRRDDTIESLTENGYSFQGYNIYQMIDESFSTSVGHKIFTHDIKDGVTSIYGDSFDPLTGYLTYDIIQNGNDSGIPKTVTFEKDYVSNSPFIKGKTYYYGISAYYYNELEAKSIETNLNPISVKFQDDLPGAEYNDIIESLRLSGQSDVKIMVEVVDPTKLTGDTYEITFGEQHYYLDSDGEWKGTNYPDSIGKILHKPKDQTLSRIIPLPSIYAENNTVDLRFQLEINSPDSNNVDAISITFPEHIIINKTDIYEHNYSSGWIDNNTVTWGTSFTGGEVCRVNIDFAEPIFGVDYEILDDGWSEFFMKFTGDSSYFNRGDGTVNGYGTITLTGEIGYQFKTEKYWQLFNKSKNVFSLEYQTALSGKDLNTKEDLPNNYQTVLDGFRIKLDGTFEAPINYFSIELNDKSASTLSAINSRENLDIQNYTIFGSTISSWAIDNFGAGTSEVSQLMQDYELRFTGVYDEGTNINGQNIYQIVEGGSYATCFRMVSGAALATHPLNPNFGIAEPFLVRIPFEVWNVEDPNNPFQVNLTYRDRLRDGYENPFYVWNPNNRMYPIIVNSPYDPNQVIQVDNGPDEFNTLATWVLVMYGTNYHLGDVVKITYANPIQFTDMYTFTSPPPPKEKISPNKYELFQNYPNPFNPNTKIRYYIPEDGNVTITIYNILGQKVTEAINKNIRAGKYETEFNGSSLASGIYIYRIEVDSPTNANIYSQTKKMMLIK